MTDNDWSGESGNDYTKRNKVFPTIFQRQGVWKQILEGCDIDSVLEVGCNVGHNLRAMKWADPNIFTHGVEINREARLECLKHSPCTETIEEALDWEHGGFDLVFTCGVMIHTDPQLLGRLCADMVSASKQYVMCAEYFNATPTEIPYRSNLRLWKRDFGSYLMDEFRLRPVTQGFLWKPTTGMDNLTFWLFKKEDIE